MSEIKYEAFLEVVRSGSLSKAAQRLHYTQPGMSSLITSLENELGSKLFYRTKTGVTLTPCGEAVLPYFEEMQRNGMMVVKAAREYVEIKATMIHVGIFPCAARRWIPAIITSLKAQQLNITVIPQIDSVSQIETDLLEERTQCAFLPYSEHEDLDIVELMKDPYVAVLPAGHRLSERKYLFPKDLQEEHIIRIGNGSDAGFKTMLRRMEHTPRISFDINDDETAVGMVRAGFGVSVLPSLALGDKTPEGTVAVPVKGIQRTIGLASLKGRYRRLTDDSFRDTCLAVIRDRQ